MPFISAPHRTVRQYAGHLASGVLKQVQHDVLFYRYIGYFIAGTFINSHSPTNF
jgi:hypothetical protein